LNNYCGSVTTPNYGIIMDFRLLRNGFILGSFGIGFSGLILLATSYKQFSQSLISTGIGSLIASNLAIENCTSITSRKLSKKDKEILLLQKDEKILQIYLLPSTGS